MVVPGSCRNWARRLLPKSPQQLGRPSSNPGIRRPQAAGPRAMLLRILCRRTPFAVLVSNSPCSSRLFYVNLDGPPPEL